MDSTRIYGERIDIGEVDVRDFYNSRALASSEMSNQYAEVVNSDQNPKQADTRNRFDREYIIPKLHITKDTDVLDVGCGMGRVSEMITPLCRKYLGTDFAEQMINIAQKKTAGLNEYARFACLSFKELMNQSDEYFDGKFGCVILLGVWMYINDAELSECLERLTDLLDDHCTIYVGDAVGLEKRLTLKGFDSEQLKRRYSAIYRTAEEYTALYQIFINKGFEFVEKGYFPPEVNGTKYSDSDRWYAILEC